MCFSFTATQPYVSAEKHETQLIEGLLALAQRS